jgi:DNA repair protein RadD
MRHGPVDDLRVTEPGSGDGEAPAKECPDCCAIIHAAYAACPECGHVFPPPERERHDAEASTEGVLSGQETVTEYPVQEVNYAVHTKRGADENAARTMRVEYRIGWNKYISEWVCFEHTGYARAKAEHWWRQRSNEPVPFTVDDAVALCEAGCICQTQAVTIRHVSGEKYDRIIGHQLGPKPPRLDGSDEMDSGDLPVAVCAEDDIPF